MMAAWFVQKYWSICQYFLDKIATLFQKDLIVGTNVNSQCQICEVAAKLVASQNMIEYVCKDQNVRPFSSVRLTEFHHFSLFMEFFGFWALDGLIVCLIVWPIAIHSHGVSEGMQESNWERPLEVSKIRKKYPNHLPVVVAPWNDQWLNDQYQAMYGFLMDWWLMDFDSTHYANVNRILMTPESDLIYFELFWYVGQSESALAMLFGRSHGATRATMDVPRKPILIQRKNHTNSSCPTTRQVRCIGWPDLDSLLDFLAGCWEMEHEHGLDTHSEIQESWQRWWFKDV